MIWLHCYYFFKRINFLKRQQVKIIVVSLLSTPSPLPLPPQLGKHETIKKHNSWSFAIFFWWNKNADSEKSRHSRTQMWKWFKMYIILLCGKDDSFQSETIGYTEWRGERGLVDFIWLPQDKCRPERTLENVYFWFSLKYR